MEISKLLSGLRVLDLSTVLAGPSVGTFLAELGAKVEKWELPSGDVTRSWKNPLEKESDEVSAYFSSVNYGKQYLRRDLRKPKDYDDFCDKIRSTDLLLTNFKKGDAAKLGIEDTQLNALNPRLIHGKIVGFSADSDRVAYDLILQAESGFMSMNGDLNGLPTKMPVALIDVLAAHQLKEAILLALLHRERTGRGCTVSVSLFQAAVVSLTNQASNFLMSGYEPGRLGSQHPNIAPYGELFKTSDDVWITFAIGSDRQFEKLCNILRRDEWTNDPDFQSNIHRVQHRDRLEGLIQEVVGNLRSSELLEKCHSAQIPAAKVRTVAEVLQDTVVWPWLRHEKIDGKETQRFTSIAFEWT